MQRHFFTADDIYQLINQQNSSVLLMGPDDIITPEAEDLANKLGLRVMREMETQVLSPTGPADFYTQVSLLPPLKAVRGSR